MTGPADPQRDKQLIALARAREVLNTRRRRLLAELAKLDDERRRITKLLNDMIQPELPAARELGALPNDPAPSPLPYSDHCLAGAHADCGSITCACLCHRANP